MGSPPVAVRPMGVGGPPPPPHPRWGAAVQVMTTVGKELAAKGCKPAVATAVRKLTYRGKRKTAKERDLGKAMRWEEKRTSAGRAGRRPAKTSEPSAPSTTCGCESS